MNAGATAERTYDALKALLLSGAILPGERLEPTSFAEELNVSVTPVRDALNRLAGERIVDTRTRDGFHLPLVSEPALADLYHWNEELVRLVVHAWPAGLPHRRADTLPADAGLATRKLFDLIGARSGNVEHVAEIASVNDRLAAARIAEARVLTGIETEIRGLAVAFNHENRAAFLSLVRDWHRRRRKVLPAIVRAIYQR